MCVRGAQRVLPLCVLLSPVSQRSAQLPQQVGRLKTKERYTSVPRLARIAAVHTSARLAARGSTCAV